MTLWFAVPLPIFGEAAVGFTGRPAWDTAAAAFWLKLVAGEWRGGLGVGAVTIVGFALFGCSV